MQAQNGKYNKVYTDGFAMAFSRKFVHLLEVLFALINNRQIRIGQR
jgi:hypothetical protein